jgi:hypothetical protein
MVALIKERELDTEAEAFVARLSRAAYEEALRQGINGPFAELELAIWRQLREVVRDCTPEAVVVRAEGLLHAGNSI